MRRLIPLILALLLLAACGAEVPPTAEPTPTPTVEPTLEPLPESAPASLPDAGFEPESFWLAEPFGDGGKALLLMSGDGRFKCWYSSWYEHPEIDWLYLVGGSFTEAEAEAAAEGEALTLEYAESRDSPRPERFSAASYEEALAAFLDMPYNDEVVLPVPERISRADWEATPDFPFAVRGLGLGSTLDEVFSRFPDGPAIETAEPEQYGFLYGSDFGLLGYWDAHDASRGGPCISVSDGWTITRFIFNEDDRVCKIEFWASVD